MSTLAGRAPGPRTEDPGPPAGHHARREVALLAAGAVVLRLPALFASRHLLFDDGVYGSAVLAMRDGARPFRDVFSPQGPLFFTLLRVFDLLGLRTVNGPRLLSLAAGVTATLAVYLAARHLGPRPAALAAAVLAATSGSLLWVTGPITGDGPAVALAAAAVAATLAWRARPGPGRAVVVGLLLGGALAVKAVVAPAALPVGIWLLAGRRTRDVAWAAASAVALVAVLTVLAGPGDVFEQSVRYHLDSDRIESVGEQASKLVTTMLTRDLPLLVAVAGGGVLALVTARRGTRPSSALDTWLVSGWAVSQALLLVFEKTMFRNHIAALVPPLALLVALRPPPWRPLALLFLALLPYWYLHNDGVLRPAAAGGSEAAVVDALRGLPDGAWVISDEPGLAWRAGRRMPAWLDDASVKRIWNGDLSTERLAREADRPQVCAVVVWSYRYGETAAGFEERLPALGYEAVARYSTWHGPDGSGRRTLYTRSWCRPDRPDGSP